LHLQVCAHAGRTNPTPPSWGFPDDVASACSLFADPSELITLDWSPGALEADSAYGWKIRVDEVNLNVNTRNENNELWIYQVRGSYQFFYFREDTSVTFPGGKHRWVIVRWEDAPAGGPKLAPVEGDPRVERTTWGQIKFNYR
jgi:hypothetical protein